LNSSEEPRALWTVAPGRAELRPASPRPGDGEVIVRTLWSGISRGTERLVFNGHVPAEVADRMRAPAQEGTFPHPVMYGYCAVGRLEPTCETVFALQPHREAFAARPADLARVPDGVPPRRATLAAQMETALNAIWDSGAAPGDRIAVVGAGVVGSLIAYLAAGLPGSEVLAVDVDPSREAVAEALRFRFATPRDARGEADIVIHTSATEEGLALALSLAGEEGTVVEASWHGDRAPRVPLGGAFHARRLRLLSSQVGAVPAGRRPRWTHRRRLDKALALLADPRLDILIDGEVAFRDLPAELPRLLAPGAPGLFTAVRYDTAPEGDV
jgi:threonine dehydrogenase-like Zn-dependent dehydrogenase